MVMNVYLRVLSMSRLYLSLGLITILILISLTVFISFTKNVVTLKEDSPERTVQQFLQYISENRLRDSYNLISPTKKDECEYLSYLSLMSDKAEHNKNHKIRLTNTYIENDKAIVNIGVTEMNYSILPAPSEYGFTKRYELILIADQWLIETMEYPIDCSKNKGINLK